MIAPAEIWDERPRRGDRVKLIGSHPYAGSTGKYFTDRAAYDGGKLYPVVKLENGGPLEGTIVFDPEKEMRKL